MSSLNGRTAFVTAAGQVIGRATALASAAAGASVSGTDFDAGKLAALKDAGIGTPRGRRSLPASRWAGLAPPRRSPR
jgi:NAD(P)-dependent dehydrogenase (short-subunit alcohol dehydrogenase family)